MIAPTKFKNEKERLKALESYSILDTLPETDYDNLTAIAAEICGTPISLISLIDDKRQWFKSHHGLDATETSREHAFCAHAIHDINNIFVVQDARTDKRFHDNPLVVGNPHVVFYAGMPLVGDDGLPLGTLCVIDHQPHLLSKSQLNSLSALANQVMNLLKLRKNKAELEKTLKNLEEKNIELERFAYVAAHDLKSPLIGISEMSKLFLEEYGQKVNAAGIEMLELIESSSDKLKRMIDGLLDYSRSENILREKQSKINLETLKKDIYGLFSYDNDLTLNLKSTIDSIHTNRTAIDQILINLVANAIKYNDKIFVEITLGVSETKDFYEFYVEDNGPGIAKKYQDKIFNIFEIFAGSDRFGQTGNGIGLATVKKLIEKLGGTIHIESELGQGAKFVFTLKK